MEADGGLGGGFVGRVAGVVAVVAGDAVGDLAGEGTSDGFALGADPDGSANGPDGDLNVLEISFADDFDAQCRPPVLR